MKFSLKMKGGACCGKLGEDCELDRDLSDQKGGKVKGVLRY